MSFTAFPFLTKLNHDADSSANRKILSMLLQRRGLESDQAEQGHEGLEMVSMCECV